MIRELNHYDVTNLAKQFPGTMDNKKACPCPKPWLATTQQQKRQRENQ